MLRIILAVILCASSGAYLVSMSDALARMGPMDGADVPWALRVAFRKMGLDIQRTSAKEAGAEESYFMRIPAKDRLNYRLSGRADDYVAALTQNRELGRKAAVIRFLYTTRSALDLSGYDHTQGMPAALQEAHEILAATILLANAQIDSEDKSDPQYSRDGIAPGVRMGAEKWLRRAGASIHLQAVQERAAAAKVAAVRSFVDTTLNLLPQALRTAKESAGSGKAVPVPLIFLHERMTLRFRQADAEEAKSLSDFGKSLRGAEDELFAGDSWRSTGIGALVERKKRLAQTNAVHLFCMSTCMNALPENTTGTGKSGIPAVLKNQLFVLQAQMADQEVQRRLAIKFQGNSSPSGGAPIEPNEAFAERVGKKRDTEYERAFCEFSGCTLNMTCDEVLGSSAIGGCPSFMALAKAYAEFVGMMAIADDDAEMRRITTNPVDEPPTIRREFTPAPGGIFDTGEKNQSVLDQLLERRAQARIAAEQNPRNRQLREFYAETYSSKKLLVEEFMGTTATMLRTR